MLHSQLPEPAPREPGTVSRRRLVLTGAGLAAAGVAVGAAAAIPFSATDSGAPDEVGAAPKDPVVVHLRNANEGTFDVFIGTERIQLVDRAFAARLSNAVVKS
jgi:hypothetical protein